MARRKTTTENKRYFIVNPAGAVHETTYSHAKWRLAQPGYRMANKEEVEAATQPGAVQPHDATFGSPFTAEPEPTPEPEAVE